MVIADGDVECSSTVKLCQGNKFSQELIASLCLSLFIFKVWGERKLSAATVAATVAVTVAVTSSTCVRVDVDNNERVVAVVLNPSFLKEFPPTIIAPKTTNPRCILCLIRLVTKHRYRKLLFDLYLYVRYRHRRHRRHRRLLFSFKKLN